LLGESGGDRATGGMADHCGVLDPEPVHCLADPASLLRHPVATAGRFGRPAVPEQVDPDDAMGLGQQRNERVLRAGRRGEPVDQYECRGIGGAVLAHVDVPAVAPGYIATDNTAALRDNPERSRSILERIPPAHWGRSDDLAGATVFLCSAASDYVSGATIPVDGGWLAR
jgi:hypothetical protein